MTLLSDGRILTARGEISPNNFSSSSYACALQCWKSLVHVAIPHRTFLAIRNRRMYHSTQSRNGRRAMLPVMTIVEGRVSESKSKDFEAAYGALKGGALSPGLRMSFLARDTADSKFYRIITVWESREALDRMRSSGQVPAAIALFRSVGVEPQLRVHDVPQTMP